MPFGAILGGLGAALGLGTRTGRKTLFGQQGKQIPIQTMTPEQRDLQNQIIQQLGQLTPEAFARLSELLGGDDESFSKFEQPYLRQFERDIIPRIMERFGGSAGSHGALSSGGLNQSLAQAGTDLSTNLASLRGGMQQNALSQLQGLLGAGFQSQFSPAYRPPTGGLLGGMAPGLGALGAGYGLRQFG